MVLFSTCITKKFQEIFIFFCVSLCFQTMGTGVQIYILETHLKCTDKQACIKERKKGGAELKICQ